MGGLGALRPPPSYESVDALVTAAPGSSAQPGRELLAAGATVRVLARFHDRRALDGVGADIVTGDLLDPASLARA